MRILPITISADLIPATMEDRKLRTRRIINPRTPEAMALLINMSAGCEVQESAEELVRCNAPWKVGDILYVREGHYAWGVWEDVEGVKTPTGKKKRKFTDKAGRVLFPNTFGYNVEAPRNCMGWHKRLARFMPKKYARTFLEVTEVRTEQLCDITEAEAILEGIGGGPIDGWKDYRDGRYWIRVPRESFQTLWDKVNGDGSFQTDPWVWVISFKRVERPANFLS